MKIEIGSLVRLKKEFSIESPSGIVVDIIQKKCWRTQEHGNKIDWSKIEPEPHCVVLYSHNNGTIDIPKCDLDIVYNA